MTKAQAFDAAWKTFIGLAVVAAWQGGGRAWTWVDKVNAIVQAWPDHKETVDDLDLAIND